MDVIVLWMFMATLLPFLTASSFIALWKKFYVRDRPLGPKAKLVIALILIWFALPTLAVPTLLLIAATGGDLGI